MGFSSTCLEMGKEVKGGGINAKGWKRWGKEEKGHEEKGKQQEGLRLHSNLMDTRSQYKIN